jgi:hypothetical protein
MSQLLIEYFIRFKIIFGLALNFMFIFMMINPLKKQNKFYFDIEKRLNRKKLLDEIDLDDISDDFVSQNVRRYF